MNKLTISAGGVPAVRAVAAVLVVRVAVLRLEVVLPHVQAAVLAHVMPAVHIAAPTSSNAVSAVQHMLCRRLLHVIAAGRSQPRARLPQHAMLLNACPDHSQVCRSYMSQSGYGNSREHALQVAGMGAMASNVAPIVHLAAVLRMVLRCMLAVVPIVLLPAVVFVVVFMVFPMVLEVMGTVVFMTLLVVETVVFVAACVMCIVMLPVALVMVVAVAVCCR
jgi:hypothetical protein